MSLWCLAELGEHSIVGMFGDVIRVSLLNDVSHLMGEQTTSLCGLGVETLSSAKDMALNGEGFSPQSPGQCSGLGAVVHAHISQIPAEPGFNPTADLIAQRHACPQGALNESQKMILLIVRFCSRNVHPSS